LKFQKIPEKNPRCSQWYIIQSCKIPKRNSLYSSLHKKDKFWEILRFLNLTLFTTSDLKICHFYTAQNTQYFVLIFCTQLKSITIYTLEYFFHFFETSNFRFSKSLKNGLHGARAPNWLPNWWNWLNYFSVKHNIWE
jgi:hypothetical protein